MLLSLTIENWKSYRNKTTLTLTADRSRQHSETLATTPYYRGLKILPITAIYGGNAAGKSNLLDALRFIQQFVAHGRQDYDYIPVEPFALDDSSAKSSRFSIRFLAPQSSDGALRLTCAAQEETIYQLDFTVNRQSVVDESLSWYDSLHRKHALYRRAPFDEIDLSQELQTRIGAEQSAVLQTLAQGAGPRRLFLTNTVEQRQPLFAHIHAWFRDALRIADNDMRSPHIALLATNGNEYRDRLTRILRALDTGVEGIGLEPVSETVPTPDMRKELAAAIGRMADGDAVQMTIDSQALVAIKQDGGMSIRRVQTYRNGRPFGFEHESSGIRRLVETMPVFLDLWAHAHCTWALNEKEREFHPELTKTLLNGFLKTCANESRTQALLDTHDLTLMGQDLLRKDEIYVVERDEKGVSHLTPFGSHEGIRNDLDLRRSYLDGRFGGRPNIDVRELETAFCSQ